MHVWLFPFNIVYQYLYPRSRLAFSPTLYKFIIRAFWAWVHSCFGFKPKLVLTIIYNNCYLSFTLWHLQFSKKKKLYDIRSITIIFYYQTKTSIDFWCRWDWYCRSLILCLKAFLIKLFKTHITYNIGGMHTLAKVDIKLSM